MSEPPKASTPDERTELARWLADRRGVSFDDCDLGEQAEWRWEAEAVISKLHEHTDTDEELAMANAYAKEGWAWVDDFCEALGDGTTFFNFKERIAQLLAALEANERENERLAKIEKAAQEMVDGCWEGAGGDRDYNDSALWKLQDALTPSTPPDLREDA